MGDHVIFVSLLEDDYSRSAVYLKQLEFNHEKIDYIRTSLKIKNLMRLIKALRSKPLGQVIIMSPSHALVPFVKLFTNHKVILDAGWSLTESALIRNNVQRKKYKNIKTYAIDFISTKLSDHIFVESERQKEFFNEKFKTKMWKMSVLYTGFNELEFENIEAAVPYELHKYDLSQYFVIFLRGKTNEEMGLNYLVSVAEKVNDKSVLFIVSTSNGGIPAKHPHNMVFINRYIKKSEMKYLYLKCDLSVGQLGNVPRVQNSIAHKIFESLYFGAPLIIRKSWAVQEILNTNDSAILLEEPLVNCFLENIEKILRNPEILLKIKDRYKKIHKEKTSQVVLTRQFLNNLENISNVHRYS